MTESPITHDDPKFFTDVKQLIRTAKQQAAGALNAELTLLYWQVGRRISKTVLGGDRAEYGKQVISNLAAELTEVYDKGGELKTASSLLAICRDV